MRKTAPWLLAPVVLVACPKEQVNPGSAGEGGEGGTSTGQGAPTEATPTGGAVGSSTGGSSTGSSGGPVDGSSTEVSTSSSAGSTGGGSSTGGVDGGSSSSGGSSSGESSSTGEPPRLFDCFGCSCDAEVSFCRKVFAGFAGPDDPMCPIVDPDGLESGCVLYPQDCADPPSCGCLPLMNNNCFCNESQRLRGAYEVTCPLP